MFKTKKGKVLFIVATVFAVLALAAAVLFTVVATNALNSEINAENAGEALGSAIALVFVIIVIMIYWIIAALVTGVPAIILSAVTIKHTKWALIHLFVSIFSMLSPLIYLLILKLTTG